MLDTPSTLEERLFKDALSSMSKSMMDQLADEHMQSKAYREYIEMWVHEIKTPIAAAHLVAQNNPSLPMDDVQTQLTKIESLVEQALFYARSASVDRDFSIRDVNLQSIVKDALKNNARVFIDAGVSPQQSIQIQILHLARRTFGFLPLSQSRMKEPLRQPFLLKIMALVFLKRIYPAFLIRDSPVKMDASTPNLPAWVSISAMNSVIRWALSWL